VEAGYEGGGDRVAIVLGEAPVGQADEAIGGDARGLERRVELEPVLDPLVVGVARESRALRRPADAADGAGELALVGAGGGSGRGASAWAVEGDDRRREVADPGDGGIDVREPLRPRDDLRPADGRAVEPLAPPADVDADADHVRSRAMKTSST
jgi:hypothetical protein